MAMSNVKVPVRCTFCSREYADVKKLIAAGNTDVAICDQCVEVCNDIIADKIGRPSSSDEFEPTVEPPDLFPFKCPACGPAWKAARK
jgi:ATP-dependent Clp protease ATP-binding subunit ClpX